MYHNFQHKSTLPAPFMYIHIYDMGHGPLGPCDLDISKLFKILIFGIIPLYTLVIPNFRPFCSIYNGFRDTENRYDMDSGPIGPCDLDISKFFKILIFGIIPLYIYM